MKKHLSIITLSILLLFSANSGFAQGVAVNTDGSTANPSAMLDVKSSNQGILIPRVATTSSITSPVVGLLIFQTTAPIGFYYYDGATWNYLQNSANVTLQGNTFNGNNQLVQLNGTGKLPALDGSLLTNLPAGGAAAAGTLTGSTLASNVVNASITTLSPLTSNGIVTTNGGTGVLSVTGTTGSGSVVLATSPTLVTPRLGTPQSGNASNLTNLNATQLTSGTVPIAALPAFTGDVTTGTGSNVTTYNNIVPIAKGGTGTASPALIAGSNVIITGAWPNQTIAATSGGASATALTFISSLLNLAYAGNPTLFFNPNAGVIAATHTGVTYTGANDFADQDNIIIPFACTISSLTITSNTIFTGTGSDNTAFTVYKNGAAQGMTCTVSNTNTVGNVSSVTDNTHTFTVAAGDRISISFQESNSNGTSAPYISYGVILKTQ